MDRREMLVHSGTLVSITSLGGCLGRYRGLAGDGEETTTRGSATTTQESTTTEEPTTTRKSTTTQKRRPSVTDTAFSVTNAGCGSPTNEASVAFERGGPAVVVTGTIAGANACYTAKLADVSYEPDADALDVTVASTKREGADVCADCITEIEYEATVSFADGVPATVRVVHESMGDSKRVATADSGESL